MRSHPDIKRDQADRVSRESQARLQAVVENLTDGLIITDLEDNLLYWNPAALKLHGFASMDTGKRRWNAFAESVEIFTLDGSSVPTEQWPLARVRRGESVHDLKLRVRRVDTDWDRVLTYRGSVVQYADGESLLFLIFNDITECQQAEGALLASEARYTALLENAADAILVAGRDRQFIEANARASEMFGYTRDEFVGLPAAAVVAEHEAARQAQAMHRVLAGEQVRSERQFRRKDGTLFPGEISSGSPEPGLILGIVRDITDRKRADAALSESHQRRQDILDSMFAFFGLFTPEGICLETNRVSLEAAGVSGEDFIGHPFEEFSFWHHSIDSQAQIRDAIRRAAQGETVREDFSARMVGGELRTLDGVFSPVRDATGRVTQVVASGVDITERKQAEEALRESKEKFSAAFNVSPAALMIVSLDGKYVEVNEACCDLLGFSREEMLGKSSSDLGLFSAEARKRMAATYDAASGRLKNVEVRVRARDGTVRDVIYSLKTLPAHGDQRIFVSAIDITEHKRAQQEQTRLQAQLQRAESMAAMGALIGGVAHEVRNPLFGITATLDALEARLGKQDHVARHFQVLHSEVGRLTSLMQDLLDYGKPLTVTLVPGPFADVIAAALQAATPLAHQAQVDIATNNRAANASVAMDRERLPLVFENLLNNAIRLSGSGSSVHVETTETREHGKRWVVCTVSDTGPGFHEDDLPSAFEPFFSRREGGTGLGLAIVLRIVEHHHGTVTAANRPEGGAVVTVRLPSVRAAV